MMSLCLQDTVCQYNFTNLKIQDCGVRHFEKLKNLNIYVTDWPILPKFDVVMSLYPLDPVNPKNLVVLKIKDGGGHLET